MNIEYAKAWLEVFEKKLNKSISNDEIHFVINFLNAMELRDAIRSVLEHIKKMEGK